MYTEADLLPISALQHLLFCERQAALIHIERLWAENRYTVEGRGLHTRTHGEQIGPRGGGTTERRAGLRTARAVQLRSLCWGIYGVADAVEFRDPPLTGAGDEPRPIGPIPYPVEYKRGRPKSHDADRVQLCAQALCLEEMLARPVPAGALFYGKTRRREEVPIDGRLRARTADAITRMHELLAAGKTPIARREKKCERCSLLHLCLPDAAGARRSAAAFTQRTLRAALAETADEEPLPGDSP